MSGLTPSQTVGPFFAFGLHDRAEVVPPDAPGALRIRGRVLDGAGEPVDDAMVEVWQADDTGAYRGDFGFGRCGTNEEGGFELVTVKPGRVDGQAPHVNVHVFARGLLKQVATRIYFPDEAEANAADAVLASLPDDEARATLVAVPEGDGSLRFDVHLQGERETAFFAL
jgi:protocatechuate 3,4-dioxygenase alpha subunit